MDILAPNHMWEQLGDWQDIGMAGGGILAALLIGLALHAAFWRVVRGLSTRTSNVLDDSLLRHGRRPTLVIFPAIASYLALPFVRGPLGDTATQQVANVLSVALTLAGAWLAVRLLSVAEDVISARFDVDVADNLRARGLHTQFRIIRRIGSVTIGLVTIALLLASSENFRELGTGILASAGIVGLVVGLAAQKTLGNLLAGIQIAITQPIRLDDVVIVEEEWGWIEEITLTYVVVRIWDLRRLVLPIGYFLEKPFQNWTRVSADILGTVYLYVDYSVPVDAIRDELQRIVAASEHWDGKVSGIQITDATAQTVELRALVSAADSSKAWDLRCEVRERLIAFLRSHYPGSLPKLRTEITASSPGSSSIPGAPST